MAEAHVFLLPSVIAADGDEEGTPTVLAEASCAGLPVLSTRHSGIPEMVLDGRTGFLVPERDVAALADRLEELLARPELWAEMGREGRRHVEAEFDVRKLNQRLVSLYAELGRRPAGSTAPPAADNLVTPRGGQGVNMP
jgi:colanic acid/amylovoran biosynthesis glycosyltransferase